MNTGIDTTTAVTALPQQANARAPDRESRRAIEPSENASLRADQQQDDGAPILQLVRKSAETFSRLMATLKDPAAAAAFSGYSGPVGKQVDTFA